MDRLGEPKAARLHIDRARKGGTALVHLVNVWVGPAQVEVLSGLADHEHINASLADNLIRELGSVTLYVLCLGSVHAASLDQALSATGPSSTAPSISNRQPWHEQSQQARAVFDRRHRVARRRGDDRSELLRAAKPRLRRALGPQELRRLGGRLAQHPGRRPELAGRRLALSPSGRNGTADGQRPHRSPARRSTPPARSSARVRAPSGTAKVEMVLEPRDGGTHVTMIEVAADPLSKLALNRLTDPLVHHRNVESLRRLQRISETGVMKT